MLENGKPVDAGHVLIEQYHLERLFIDQLQRLFAVRPLHNLASHPLTEKSSDIHPHIFVIINNKDPGVCHGTVLTGQTR